MEITRRWADDGILANALMPGGIATPLQRHLPDGWMEQAVKQMERYRVGPWMYNPAVLGTANGLLGAINMGNAVGGTNWPGVAYDPETHTVFAQANNVNITATSLVAPRSRAGQEPDRRLAGSMLKACRFSNRHTERSRR